MLTDDELTAAANRHLQADGDTEWIAELIFVADPPGGWPVFRHKSGREYTGGPIVFFIDRLDGFVTKLNPAAWRAVKEWLGAGLPGAREFPDYPVLLSAVVKHMLRDTSPRYAHLQPPSTEELRLAMERFHPEAKPAQ